MRLNFHVPREFTVYGIPQRHRPACLIEADVVELVRMTTPPRHRWFGNRRGLLPKAVGYFAYAAMPPWIVAPDSWPRLETGHVQLRVSLQLNARAQFPEFPAGVSRIFVESEAL